MPAMLTSSGLLITFTKEDHTHYTNPRRACKQKALPICGRRLIFAVAMWVALGNLNGSRDGLKTFSFLDFDNYSFSLPLNDDSFHNPLPQVLWQVLGLPMTFFPGLNLGIHRIAGDNRFQRIKGSAVGMLRNVGSSHSLTRSARSKASRVIFDCLAGSRVSRKRGSAYFGHAKHACADPCPAGFDRLAGAVILRVGLFEKGQHPLSAICGPDCQCFLFFSAVFFISKFCHGQYRSRFSWIFRRPKVCVACVWADADSV
ncbi:MAG: hypothetical protein JW987_03030 [Anaerolineaceae bacterium]|nr:hypothetical protein [Anaerolineaceae bacterium]